LGSKGAGLPSSGLPINESIRFSLAIIAWFCPLLAAAEKKYQESNEFFIFASGREKLPKNLLKRKKEFECSRAYFHIQ
jgi:hypothetical protein